MPWGPRCCDRLRDGVGRPAGASDEDDVVLLADEVERRRLRDDVSVDVLRVVEVVPIDGGGREDLTFDTRGADLLYQVFNKRYQRSSTIVTTNLPFKDWGKLFTNSAAASAIADRLVHKGLLVRITGKSRRSDVEVEAPQAA